MRVRARARPLTSPPRALLLAVAVALALAGPPASGGVVFAAGAKMPRGGVRMSSKTQASMPGLEDDPVMRRALKCNGAPPEPPHAPPTAPAPRPSLARRGPAPPARAGSRTPRSLISKPTVAG